MKRKAMLSFIGMAMALLTACSQKEGTDIPSPIPPETLIGTLVQDKGEAYELEGLPWYTEKEEVKKRLSEYETVYEDETMIQYRAEGKLEDGTEVVNDITVGFKNEDGYPLSGVGIRFYMEQDGSGVSEQLAETMFGQLKEFVGKQEGTYREESISHGVSYNKESGSYVMMQYMEEDMGELLGVDDENFGKVPGIDWENYSEIEVSLRLPEQQMGGR